MPRKTPAPPEADAAEPDAADLVPDIRPTGRPRKELNPVEVYKLAAFHVTQRELAGWFDVSRNTIQRRLAEPAYAEAYARGRAAGNVTLRMWQRDAARKGSAAMLIWLGKQYLEQADVTRVEHAGVPGQPLQHEHSGPTAEELRAMSDEELIERFQRRTGMTLETLAAVSKTKH